MRTARSKDLSLSLKNSDQNDRETGSDARQIPKGKGEGVVSPYRAFPRWILYLLCPKKWVTERAIGTAWDQKLCCAAFVAQGNVCSTVSRLRREGRREADERGDSRKTNKETRWKRRRSESASRSVEGSRESQKVRLPTRGICSDFPSLVAITKEKTKNLCVRKWKKM